MERRIALNLWRWPLASVLGLASVGVSLLAAGIAFRGLMAVPPHIWPWLEVSLVTVSVGWIIQAILRRRGRVSTSKTSGPPASVGS